MQKKLTITIDEQIYIGLREVIGSGKISHFIQELGCPHVFNQSLEKQYQQMSLDEARENQALKWSESVLEDYHE